MKKKEKNIVIKYDKRGVLKATITLGMGISVLKKALKKKDYSDGWRSNIAVAFQDEYDRCKKKYKNRSDIHNISNKAARNFLNLLIGKNGK